jgi:hypothetical protein
LDSSRGPSEYGENSMVMVAPAYQEHQSSPT